MNDYIRRQDAVDAVHEEFDGCTVWDESGKRTADEVESIIDRVPSADVVPVVHAHWKDNKNGTVSCSRCLTWFQKEREPYLRFCGYCGAKMVREE